MKTTNTTNTLGETESKEWKATLMNAYGDTYEEWCGETTVAKVAFCEVYDEAMDIANSLAYMDDDKPWLYNAIGILKADCRQLNRLWAEGEKE